MIQGSGRRLFVRISKDYWNYQWYLGQLAVETELGFDELLHRVGRRIVTVLCLAVAMGIKKHGPNPRRV